MAVSFTRVSTNPTQEVVGDRVQACVDVTLDSSYTTGGYSLAPLCGSSSSSIPAPDFVDAQLLPITGAVLFLYNFATQKLQVFTNAGAEVANATNLSTVTGRLQVLGKGSCSFAPSN